MILGASSPNQTTIRPVDEAKRRTVIEGLLQRAVRSRDGEGVMRILHRPDLRPRPSEEYQTWADVAMYNAVTSKRVDVARSLIMNLKALGASLDCRVLVAPIAMGDVVSWLSS